jgi:hypothetical protein
MATVTNNLSRIHDAEGTLTTANLPAGGAGATANTDIFLQGSQSLGRRQTNTTDTGGFLLVDAADNDVSAADVHVAIWFWVTHFGILDDLRVVFGTGTGSPTNYDAHTFPFATEYPALGGWVRAWVDISRTPEFPGGTGLNEAALRSYGVQISFTSAPGGNAQNLILDAADFIAGSALSLTGTGGLWSDFTTADQNPTNQYGVFRVLGGVYNCFARVQLGTSSSLVFDDSNFAIVFPQQNLVADNFMGISCDLQNAATNIDWVGGVIRSAGTKRGDLVITGTSGAFDAASMTFSALRAVTLTSICSVTNTSFVSCGQIAAAGANLSGSAVSGYEGAADTAALVWDVATDTNGKLDNLTFTKGTAATHAIELGTTSPTTVTFSGITFSGYNASNGQNDSTVLVSRTGGTVTINVSGGTTPTYKTAGATVVVASSVSVSITVVDKNNLPIENAQTAVFLSSDNSTVMNQDTNASGIASTSFSGATPAGVYIRVRKSSSPGTKYIPVSNTDTIKSTGLSVTITLLVDNNA